MRAVELGKGSETERTWSSLLDIEAVDQDELAILQSDKQVPWKALLHLMVLAYCQCTEIAEIAAFWNERDASPPPTAVVDAAGRSASKTDVPLTSIVSLTCIPVSLTCISVLFSSLAGRHIFKVAKEQNYWILSLPSAYVRVNCVQAVERGKSRETDGTWRRSLDVEALGQRKHAVLLLARQVPLRPWLLLHLTCAPSARNSKHPRLGLAT